MGLCWKPSTPQRGDGVSLCGTPSILYGLAKGTSHFSWASGGGPALSSRQTAGNSRMMEAPEGPHFSTTDGFSHRCSGAWQSDASFSGGEQASCWTLRTQNTCIIAATSAVGHNAQNMLSLLPSTLSVSRSTFSFLVTPSSGHRCLETIGC